MKKLKSIFPSESCSEEVFRKKTNTKAYLVISPVNSLYTLGKVGSLQGKGAIDMAGFTILSNHSADHRVVL